MAVATLGFDDGGPSVSFRLDPKAIDWKFEIITNVADTMGGRVVQVLGAELSDLTITGDFGEDKRGSDTNLSWEIAESFYARIKKMMDWQAKGAAKYGKMGQPAIFTYPPLDIRFWVYIKSIQDPDGGGSITHRTGKFSYGYVLTLFIVPGGSGSLNHVGGKNSVVSAQRAKAINDFINRISDGIGWKFSSTYNGLGVSDNAVTTVPGRKISTKTRTLPS
jgi:hypothetical protein